MDHDSHEAFFAIEEARIDGQPHFAARHPSKRLLRVRDHKSTIEQKKRATEGAISTDQ